MAIIDFHSHILPGIDDGSRSLNMTLAMLKAAQAQHIDVMVATPHFYAESMSVSGFLDRRNAALEQVLPRIQGPQICVGAEIAFFPGMGATDEIDKLTLGRTNLLLVEMPFRQWTHQDLQELSGLLRRGFRPILAHLERFLRFQSDRSILTEVLELPVLVQLNAEDFLRWTTRGKVLRLFREGKAHLLGSDCHNVTSRPQNLAAARAVLEQKLGLGFLHRMDERGERLLSPERTIATPF